MLNQGVWNKFVAENSSPSSFLQSWQWGEFQKNYGLQIYRLRIEAGLQAQVIVKKLPLGRTYLEIPKGPIIQTSDIRNKDFSGFYNRLREIGKKEKAVLARINPPYTNFQKSGILLRRTEPPSPFLAPLRGREIKGQEAWRRPEILIHQTEPEDTALVDLSKSEAELMYNMHEKSRYNIRLAQKKRVTVRLATPDKQAFEIFLKLLDETTRRDRMTSWPNERFWKFREKFMIHNSSPPPLTLRGEGELFPRAELLLGEHDGQILAAAIIMLFGDAGTYLYAASSSEERSANVPSLVLWEAIRLAKSRGKKWYDMWGIAPAAADENHPWAGITRFKARYVKAGVTGKEIRNLGTLDLVLDKKFYTFFKIVKKLCP